MTIGSAAPADLPAILDLLQSTKLPRADIERFLDSALVARENGRVVGCAAIEPYGDAGLLRSVAVDATLRGRGLGGRLTAAALDLARRRGIATVFLLTETAAEFFPRFGFRPIPRDAVDPQVQRSVEFTKACPASAQAMRADLE